MRLWAVVGVVMGGVLSVSAAQAPVRPAPVKTEVAPGVYLFRTAPYGEVGMDGNVVAIVAPDATALRERIAAHRWFLEQKRGVQHTFPDVTFTDELTIHLGDREIQVRHRERAVTPGDAFLYLPKERILVTGDLLVNPISFALSVYPSGWVKTLEWMDALNAAVIVPGHGDVLKDEALLHATLDIFRRLIAHGRDAKARGLSAFAASDGVYPLLREPMVVLTGDDPARNGAFRAQLVEWFMHRVYDELAGPLSDAIAPIPMRR